MINQKITWTALPNGKKGDKLRISLFVSPRLEKSGPTDTLSGDFLDWPAKVSTLLKKGFSVEFDGYTTNATSVSPLPDSKLWHALFKPNTTVKSHEFNDLSSRIIRSYPVKNVESFLKENYQKIATSNPVELPSVVSLVGELDEVSGLLNDIANLDSDVETDFNNHYLSQKKAYPPGKKESPQSDFLQVKIFHRPHLAKPEEGPTQTKIPEVDFHNMLSSLGSYPVAMRWLGLIIDLEVPLDQTILSRSKLRVRNSGFQASDFTPWTTYDPATFMAAPGPNDPGLRNGFLRLNDFKLTGEDGEFKVYDVGQVDLDGAALKAMDFANNLIHAEDMRTVDTPKEAGLPSLRSGGIYVVRTGRASKLVDDFQKSKTLNDNYGTDDTTLFAEALIRGYRFDIWDEDSKRWHSLCQRKGMYVFGDLKPLEAEDEGWVPTGVTGSPDNSSPDLYLHESLAHWDGWSLVAPRPGNIIHLDDSVTKFTNVANTEFKLVTTFIPKKGSLPWLRFGVNYRIRARAVDIAGNSVEPESGDSSQATDSFPYCRFEPISSPALIPREPPTPGESLERLVIRSNYNMTTEEYITSPAVKALLEGKNYTYLVMNERHIAPPKAAQLLAETHGMFDGKIGTSVVVKKEIYNVIVLNDGSFNQLEPHSVLKLPYLPDPLAPGVAFQDLPGFPPGTDTLHPFESKGWPDLLPFRIRIVEGTGEPRWIKEADGARVLEVLLPKAEMARVRISSYLNSENDLERMGIWKWIEEATSQDPTIDLSKLKNLALQGRHWMLTPSREIMLIHAVQQPIDLPVVTLDDETHLKSLGKTFAELYGTVAVHGNSTGKVDMMANWEEPVDNLADPAPKIIPGNAHVFEAPVNLDGNKTDVGGGQVYYTAQNDGRGLLNLGLFGNPILPPRHEFSDTKHRFVHYEAIVTTRFRENFAPERGSITPQEEETMFTRKSEMPFDVHILSSARPAAPNVLYILPTFGFGEKTGPDGIVVHERSGGGLRVYLDRTWFSSGEGELLGVVLWQGGTDILDELKPYVTQWGMDPIWGSNPTKEMPLAEDFKKRTETGSNLSLAELEKAGSAYPANYRVSVAGHMVDYDEIRKLWFCDIMMDSGTPYYPFVRMALARYQSKSVENAELSPVVLADFAQLAPDRSATVKFVDPTKLTVSVNGVGYSKVSYGDSDVKTENNMIEVSVEKRSPNVADDDLAAWMLDSTFNLAPTPGPDSTINWTGDVTLPEARVPKKFRLVIKEYERFRVEGLDGLQPKTERRLVNAFVLEI